MGFFGDEVICWTSTRGSDRVGASRGRSAACAADTALSTSSLRSYGFPRSSTRRANAVTAPRRLALSLIPLTAGTSGLLKLRRNGFLQGRISCGAAIHGAYGRAMNSVRDLHARALVLGQGADIFPLHDGTNRIWVIPVLSRR